jgi:hypothetical protein
MDSVPEIEKVPTPDIQDTIKTVLQEKTSTEQFVLSPYHLQRVSFKTNLGFSNAYSRIVEACLEDPKNLVNGNEGIFLEYLYREILNTIITDQSIYLSPASLDNKLFEDISPADLILGKKTDLGYVCPLLLISSKLSKGDKKSVNHLLNSPEITLKGRRFFGSRKDVLSILADLSSTKSKESFTNDISRKYGSKIFEKIFTDLTAIEEMIWDERFTKRKPFNRTVMWKIDRLRDI